MMEHIAPWQDLGMDPYRWYLVAKDTEVWVQSSWIRGFSLRLAEPFSARGISVGHLSLHMEIPCKAVAMRKVAGVMYFF